MAQRAVADTMCAVRETHPFSVVATTGDNFYPAGTATSATWNRPMRCLISGKVQWRAAWGNHDIASGNSTGAVLGARRWYSWSAGGATFVTLDANRPGSSRQVAFLKRALTTSRAAIKIVLFHHAGVTVSDGHTDDALVRKHWMPIFEQHDVTLVLQGHSHTYEHSVVNGVHYVVTGGGGARLHRCARRPGTLLRCESAHHFLLLEIHGDRLKVRAIGVDGSTLDDFVLPA